MFENIEERNYNVILLFIVIPKIRSKKFQTWCKHIVVDNLWDYHGHGYYVDYTNLAKYNKNEALAWFLYEDKWLRDIKNKQTWFPTRDDALWAAALALIKFGSPDP